MDDAAFTARDARALWPHPPRHHRPRTARRRRHRPRGARADEFGVIALALIVTSTQALPAHAYKRVGCLMTVQNDITALQYEDVRDLIYLNSRPLNLLFLNPAGQRVQSAGVPWVAFQNACADVRVVRVGPLVRGYRCPSGACEVIDSSTLAAAREKAAAKTG